MFSEGSCGKQCSQESVRVPLGKWFSKLSAGAMAALQTNKITTAGSRRKASILFKKALHYFNVQSNLKITALTQGRKGNMPRRVCELR